MQRAEKPRRPLKALIAGWPVTGGSPSGVHFSLELPHPPESSFIHGIFWGGFSTALERAPARTFCGTCRMRDNMFNQTRDLLHYNSRSESATCPGAYVRTQVDRQISAPRIQASKGGLGPRILPSATEKFLDHRHWPSTEWARLKANDSTDAATAATSGSLDFAAERAANPSHHAWPEATSIDFCHESATTTTGRSRERRGWCAAADQAAQRNQSDALQRLEICAQRD